jgi:hypothetical protein
LGKKFADPLLPLGKVRELFQQATDKAGAKTFFAPCLFFRTLGNTRNHPRIFTEAKCL